MLIPPNLGFPHGYSERIFPISRYIQQGNPCSRISENQKSLYQRAGIPYNQDMREWNLKAGDPLSLTLSADARLSQTDYCNDQIWELSLEGGEPVALALQTTFGLRARSLRLFPRFGEDGVHVIDPADFSATPLIRQFYPNYLSVSLAPFPNLEVNAEFWIPHSQAVAGRLRVINHGLDQRTIQIDWISILMTSGAGERMGPNEFDNVHVLVGSTGDLAPVMFMTGGPQASTAPYPALTQVLELTPNQAYTLTWTLAGLSDARASFDLARDLATRNWEAELARIELFNSRDIEIYTGDLDWDAAFAFSQKVAYGLFMRETAHLEFPSFVLTRQPDQGFSIRGDGVDYNYTWNGQTPLDAYYACSFLLPASPDLAQGLLCNFINSASEDGFIDWKPGLGGQRSQLLATPLLANLTWRIYESTRDLAFLQTVYTPLLEFIRLWFTPKHDRDGDGIPEWDHAMQAGFDDHSLFSPWLDWSQGAEISTAESPGLCAFLYGECQALSRIARELGMPEAIPGLEALADNLRTAVEISWDPVISIYRYWDRDSHYCTGSEILVGERLGSGEIPVDRDFDHPIRLLLRLKLVGEATRPIRVFIHGTTHNGQHIIEPIPYSSWRWHLRNGTATGDRIYNHVERIHVEGLEETDLVIARNVAYTGEDHSLLLPLWASIPAKERAQVLVENSFTNPDRFWRCFGIPSSHNIPANLANEAVFSNQVHMPWNLLLGEGLLAYGYQQEATELLTRLMKAVVQTLKRDRSFRKYYHPETGLGTGDPNSLEGLAPVSLFLGCLGVNLVSPKMVCLRGINPFPWPVTVKYRGLTVLRQLDKTIIIFPTGKTITVSDPSPCIVSLDRIHH
jgi:hypothetical protein